MPSTEKIDLFKLYKDQYVSPKQPKLVEIKKAKYLAVSGRGEPGGEEFAIKIGALYGVAYTAKMTRKFADPKQWNWKLLIRTPDFVENIELKNAVDTLLKKGKEPQTRLVKFESFTEGLCVQMLHVGPYEKEPETILQMEAFIKRQEMEFHGRHHEIYISDPRRVPPERLKTILRHPVRKEVY
jgi:hypothetical protein